MIDRTPNLRLAAWTLPLLLLSAGVTASRLQAAEPSAPAAPKKEYTLEDLGVMVRTEGLKGTMHGVRPDLGYFVFTWRHPRNFFANRDFSAYPANSEVAEKLGAMARHQTVVVHGRLVQNPSSQPHLVVESVEPGEKWSPGLAAAPRTIHPMDVRRDFRKPRRIRALVHALAADGGMLVVEYKDEVLPVQVPVDPALRKAVGALYRGDRVELRVQVAERPESPAHLSLAPDAKNDRPAVVVTDAIHIQHDQVRTVEGRLVLFPKSPSLNRSIWGVEDRGPDGLHRYFTIFNFDDAKDQALIDAKLQAAWDGRGDLLDTRNKYVHSRARVRVTGKVNDPAQNQANPTLVTDAAKVTVISK